MNIFKIGLLLSVLLFNLSCGVIPDEIEFSNEETLENAYLIDELDLNVQDQSFIELEPSTNAGISEIISYLNRHGIYNESSISDLNKIPSKLRFTPQQLNELEVQINKYQTSSLQKNFLQSVISFLRTEANE